jgi:acetolactate synthase II small subunit
MKINNTWRIRCNHTPEVIDRIVMPVRKRGLSIEKMTYERDGVFGNCHLEFEVDEADANRIYKNLMRVTDILEVEKLLD